MSIEDNGKTSGVYVIPALPPPKMAKKNSFWHIDKEMLRFKIHFFLFIGAQAAVTPYIILFAKERLGLSASSLGAVLTAQMFVFIFTKTLTGYIADYFNRLKAVICILTIINGSGYFLLMTIPKHQPNGLYSTTPISETGFGVAGLCPQMEYTTSFHPLTNLNYTDNYIKSETCEVCYISYEFFLTVLEQHSLTKVTSKNDSLDHEENVDILVLFCKRECTIGLILCNDDYKSSIQNYPANLTVFILQYSTECNLSNLKREDIPFCGALLSHSSYKDSNESNTDTASPRIISDFQTIQFWLFAFIFSLSSVTANATFTLSDTACCESIQKSGAEFGRQRLWGAVGWGAVAPLAGFLNDYTNSFFAATALMAIMLLLFLWNLSKLNLVKPHFSQNILHDVGTVLRSKEFLSFELVILMNGISLGMVWFYVILFLRSIGGSELLCGLCLTVQSFGGSLPFMFYSGWIIKKIGHFRVLILSLFTNVVRFLWYSYLRNPWWALPVEVTHGITYGLYYTALASYGKLSAKPGTEATTQSIIFSTNEGLGCGLGCVFAGLGFDYFGGHQTFFTTGIFSACGFAVSLALSFLVVGKHNKTIQITHP